MDNFNFIIWDAEIVIILGFYHFFKILLLVLIQLLKVVIDYKVMIAWFVMQTKIEHYFTPLLLGVSVLWAILMMEQMKNVKLAIQLGYPLIIIHFLSSQNEYNSCN